MRPEEIVGIIRSNLSLGLVILGGLLLLFLLGYFLVYKKLLGGRKRIKLKSFILYGGFGLYIIMVLGVTLLDRGSSYTGKTNLHFLSSYREAWNSGSLRAWQMQILNIIMFMPFGFILPILNKKYRNFTRILLASFLFTLFIELTQLITGLGIFELDDLFNNVLGGVLGYCLIMSIISLFKERRNKGKKFIKYISPVLLVVLVFFGIYRIYDNQEFGNLEEKYSYKRNMEKIKLINNIGLDSERKNAPVYSAPKYDKITGLEFVTDKFEKLGIDTKDMDIIQYNKDASYRVNGDVSYHIWLEYLDGSYEFTDFSLFEEDKKIRSIDKEALIKELKRFDIDLPDIAAYREDEGVHIWSVDKYLYGDKMLDGSISCEYYDDGIKRISNNLIEYKKVKDSPIISEAEAYQEVEAGRFRHYKDDIKTIELRGVEVDYRLDSKGYYQPVYLFDLLIDGSEDIVYIEAIY